MTEQIAEQALPDTPLKPETASEKIDRAIALLGKDFRLFHVETPEVTCLRLYVGVYKAVGFSDLGAVATCDLDRVQERRVFALREALSCLHAMLENERSIMRLSGFGTPQIPALSSQIGRVAAALGALRYRP